MKGKFRRRTEANQTLMSRIQPKENYKIYYLAWIILRKKNFIKRKLNMKLTFSFAKYTQNSKSELTKFSNIF